MEREILFRGKSVVTGEWVEGHYFEHGEHCILNTRKVENDMTKFVEKIDPKTLGQYTVLRDKNGTRIFEGDILKNDRTGEIGFVSWHGTMAGFILNKLPREKNGGFCWGELFHSYMKRAVIGNIHDNPELMGGTNNETNPV